MAVQTCDQAITFRNFNYARALEVVQDEEYLDDVDFDEIRLRRKQGEVFQAIDNFNEKIENNFEILSEDSDILGEFDNFYQESHHREKRQLFGSSCNTPTTTTIRPTTAAPVSNIPSWIGRKKRSIFCSGTTPPGWPGIIATGLTTAAILIAANPAPGLTPSSSPQPGTPGGGGLPSANPGNILALVPAGLVAVATFPPFLPADRIIDAVAVIFREPPGTVPGTDLTPDFDDIFVNKRSSGYSPRPTLLDRFLKNVRCLGPRLAARFGKSPVPVVDYGYGKAKCFVFSLHHHYVKNVANFFWVRLSSCRSL